MVAPNDVALWVLNYTNMKRLCTYLGKWSYYVRTWSYYVRTWSYHVCMWNYYYKLRAVPETAARRAKISSISTPWGRKRVYVAHIKGITCTGEIITCAGEVITYARKCQGGCRPMQATRMHRSDFSTDTRISICSGMIFNFWVFSMYMYD